MYDPEQPKLALCDDQEAWDGEEGGKVQDGGDKYILWLMHIDVWQKPTQHCKVIILQLKMNTIF